MAITPTITTDYDGNYNIEAADGATPFSSGGFLFLKGGEAGIGGGGAGGGIRLDGGNASAGGGGLIFLEAGSSNTGQGGDITFQAGTGAIAGGDIFLTAAPGTNVAGVGGNVQIDAGNAPGASGIAGKIILRPGSSGSPALHGAIEIKGPSNSTVSELRFLEASNNGTNYVALKSPTALGANVTLTLPSTVGTSGQALTTDGLGGLSFTTVGGTPGGANTQVQFNDASVFGGDADLTWNKTTNTLALNGVISNAVGTAALPSYTFTGDLNTGMYNASADSLGFTTSGVVRLTLSTTSLTSTLPVLGPAGSASAPTHSFSGDPDTGIYSFSANTLGVSAGGISIVTISTSSVFLPPFGASAGNTTELRFGELAANGTNYVGVKAADSIASNVIWTLPNADGTAGQALTTNGAGVLSFSAVSSTTPYDVAGSVLGLPAAGITVFKFAVGRAFTLNPTGAVHTALANTDPASGSTATFTIRRRPVGGGAPTTLGTMTFAPAAAVGTVSFTFGTNIAMLVGQEIEIVYTTQDSGALLGFISFTFQGQI